MLVVVAVTFSGRKVKLLPSADHDGDIVEPAVLIDRAGGRDRLLGGVLAEGREGLVAEHEGGQPLHHQMDDFTALHVNVEGPCLFQYEPFVWRTTLY